MTEDGDLNMEPGGEHWGVPFWVRCECLDWWCKTHQLHVWECECPYIEDLLDDLMKVIQ